MIEWTWRFLVSITPLDKVFKTQSERARSGDSGPFQELVDARRAEGLRGPAVLVQCARSRETLRRRASVVAAQGRTEPEVVAAVVELVHDPCDDVRLCLARALENAPTWPLHGALERLLHD